MIQEKKFIPLRKLHKMEETQMKWLSRTFGKNTIKGARYDEGTDCFVLAVEKEGKIVRDSIKINGDDCRINRAQVKGGEFNDVKHE